MFTAACPQKGHSFVQRFPRLRPLVLLIGVLIITTIRRKRRRRVWSIGGMILAGKNGSTWRKTCPSVTMFNTNFTRTGHGSNPWLTVETLTANSLLQVTVLLNDEADLSNIYIYIYKLSSYIRENTNHKHYAVNANNGDSAKLWFFFSLTINWNYLREISSSLTLTFRHRASSI